MKVYNRFRTVALALAITSLPMLSTAIAAAPGTHACVKLAQIESSPAIDDKTILIKLRDGHYKRVDLASRCAGIEYSGFAHSTPSDDLCTSSSFTVPDETHAVCMIERIVDISDREGKTLAEKRK